jgi:hypothetical protein
MGEYTDELKNLRKELRLLLAKEGVKASVRGQRGTGWGWTDIDMPKGKQQWTPKEMKILEEDAGISIGHPSNSGLLQYGKIGSVVGSLKYKKFKKSKKYQSFRNEFVNVARNQADSGTCCGGAGTIVCKHGKAFDWIPQTHQSDDSLNVAERIMQNRANKLGLSFKHEAGWMD